MDAFDALSKLVRKDMENQVKSMTLITFLNAIKEIYAINGNGEGPNSTSVKISLIHWFAIGMHVKGKAFHWDDCATQIIGAPHGEEVFTHEEALLVNEVKNLLYCEYLFKVSNALLSEG